MEVGLGPGDFVLDGDSAPLPKKGLEPPAQFSAHVYCDHTAGWITMALGMEVSLGLGQIVLDGDPASVPKKGQSPQFSAHFYCGQTAGCIKMPLRMEVGLSPGDFVFDGDLAPPPQKKRHRPQPIFDQCLLWPTGWMDEDATWYRSRVRPGPRCVRRGPSFRREKGTAAKQPLLFGPCLLWP